MSTVDIRRKHDRFHTQISWLESHHSFSFSNHWDPLNTHHGLLLVNNDDIVRPGYGFETHPHRDMEIVTWVLSGEIEHKDSQGNQGIIYPGLAQRMSAGRGIWHSEKNPSKQVDAHLVQMWVLPDTEHIDPGYEQLDINAELDKGGLVPVASGKGHDHAISIRQAGAALWAGRLVAGESVPLPDAANVHLFVARGALNYDGVADLESGDSVRLSGAGSPAVAAGDQGAEILVWETA